MRLGRWTAVTESGFPWEQEALDFLREHLPDHEPWHAWSNFEFIDDQGRVNEADLLLLCPRGLILIEIKSRPGTVEGDAHSWTWTNDGRKHTTDNPLLLANRKAKRLASLLRQQDAIAKGKVRVPFVAEVVFLSKARPPLKLPEGIKKRVFLRGQPSREDDNGIVQALAGGLDDAFPRGTFIDATVARAVVRAIRQAGIRPSLRHRRVGDYELQEVIGEGEGFQDFAAKHVSQGSLRRVRLYAYAQTASKEARTRLMRSAAREFKVLEGIEHPGIVRVLDYRDTDRGPALIFEHDQNALRLDHFVRERGSKIGAEVRLGLMRQIAEAIQYAHEKRLYHRALSPLSVLVREPLSERPRIKVMNWQTATRNDSSLPTPQRTTGTAHIDEYLADPARLYVAPEAREGLGPAGPHLDVFSLGAIGYLLFTLEPPASSPLDLPEKLRRHGGLRISQAIDGVNGDLDDLIQLSTTPDVASRIKSIPEFLEYLSLVERELSPPTAEVDVDPGEAKPSDRVGHGLVLKERLGSGGSSEALLVTRENDNAELVLKIARDGGHNDRLRAEADALQRLRHTNIVSHIQTLEFAGRVGILMERAGKQTLAQLIRSPEPPSLDLAQRFGEELLEAVRYLEDQGIQHRDIKPDNIGIAEAPGSGRKRLVLFDFSLARTAPENIEAGTRPYLDPFLSLRKSPRWDLYAERFAAAVTLYEMLTGHVPTWGDGLSDPALVDQEVNIESDRFDPALRDGLHRFFERALRRDTAERFGNAGEMLRDWRHAFAPLEHRPDAPESLAVIARRLIGTTSVAELGYGIEARDVLDKMGVHTVAQLLAIDRRRFRYLKNVGERIRKEIREKVKQLARLRPDLVPGGAGQDARAGRASIDRLYEQLPREGPGIDDSAEDRVLAALLGIDAIEGLALLPTAGQVARALRIARSAVADALERARERWHKCHDINQIRDEIGAMLADRGGILTAIELADSMLAARGSVETDLGDRRQLATAVLRAAIELEGGMEKPRFRLFADAQPPLIANDEALVAPARRLGKAADELIVEEPLPSADRAVEALRQAAPELNDELALTHARLLRLAAAVSERAALSSRLELYPRGLEAVKALRLSLGSLVGVRCLSAARIEERVRGRYPDAESLPGRPALDGLLEEVGAERVWLDAGEQGPGYYVKGIDRRSTGAIGSRHPTTGAAPEPTAEVLSARELEAKLKHAHRNGGYLVVTVEPRHQSRAEAELLRRFPRTRLSIDRLLIDLLRAKAQSLGINWQKVLEADATNPGSRDFSKLLELVRRAGPELEEGIARQPQAALVVYPGLLARYDLLGVLDKLRTAAGTRDGPPSLWLLVPQASSGLPMLDGHPIPVLSNAEWLRLNETWLTNAHRAGTAAA